MARRSLIRWIAPLAIALLGRAAPGGSIATPTGNAEVDFPDGSADVVKAPNVLLPSVDPEGFVRSSGLSPGWQMKDVRLSYDRPNDRLAVGVNFFGIAGDADGDGNPGGATRLPAGGFDLPHLGGRESVTIGFDFNNDGLPEVVAGVPSNKASAGPGLNGFNVALYNGPDGGLASSYGTALPGNLGGLLFDPSPEHPDFEFVITNFSKLPGYTTQGGFTMVGYAGTPDDGVEEAVLRTGRVSFEEVPEPATLLAWTLVAGAAAWAGRRRRRPGN